MLSMNPGNSLVSGRERDKKEGPPRPLLSSSLSLILRHFVVEKKIGQGQFSVVYRARNVRDGKIVALKKIQVGARTQAGMTLGDHT